MLPARPPLRSAPVEFHPEGYSGAEDKPLEDYGLGGAEIFTLGGPAAKAARGTAELALSRGLPWLARSASAGGIGAGTFQMLSDLTRLGEPDVRPLENFGRATAAGAVMTPPLERAAMGAGGLLRRFAPRRPIAAPVAVPPTPVGVAGLPPIEPAPAPSAAPARPRIEVPRQPLTGRSAQQAPGLEDVVAQIKADPNYLRRIDELGGGRVVSNRETVARAMELGPMPREEIAGWKAGTAVNEVDVTRALITADWHRQNFLRALKAGNTDEARLASEAVKDMLPGLENMRATPGRATQVQALFVQDKITKTFEELAELQAKGVPFEQMKAAAAQKIQALNRDQKLRAIGSTARDWIGALEEYATRAKLTSPITHAINTVSNALTFLPRGMIFQPIKAGVQALQGRGPEAEATLRAAFGTTSGFKSGMRKYVSTLLDDVVEPGKAEVSRVHFEFPRRLRPLDPFRQLAAADAFWKSIYQDARVYEQAFASASRQGLKGPALAKRITELSNDPPNTWLESARKEALEHTFQSDPDAVLQKLGAVQNIPGMRLVIPFLKTPYNLLKYQFQRSPLGIVAPRNLQGLARGGEQQADAAARLIGGSGLALGAWMIAKRGEVTGAYPQTPGERALWDAEGRPAYSIRVGDKWIQYNRFQPLGQYLAQAAALEDAVKAGDSKGVGGLFTSLMASSGKAMLDMPFLQGMSSILDALDDPERYADKLAAGTITGLVPNVLRDVRIQTDPTRREARGIGPSILNMLPGASQNLPAKVDLLGRTAGMTESPVLRATKVVQESRATPETRALRESGYLPSEPQSRLTKKGEAKKIEGKDRERFEREMGEATRRAIQQVSGNAAFGRLDEEQQQENLKRAVDRARSVVRNRWKRQTFQPAAAPR